MERRRLGRTGLQVSVLGYGAGAVGGLFTKGAAADQERAMARAIEAGINYFDTAAIYGNGESERNLGRALKALKADVVVGTKVRLVAEHRKDVAGAIVRGMEDSLKRMGRDHVDLFQLHNPLAAQDAGDKLAVEIALEQVAPAMEKLKASGKTRFIGFSGVGEPAALLRAVDSKLFDTVQVVYNALNPSAGGPMPAGTPGLDYGRLLDKAMAADMGTIVIRALAGGALSGTTDRHPLAMQDVPPIGSAPDFASDVARAKELEPLVRDGVAGSLTELGERFVISHPAVSTMLIGYSTLDHLEAAIAAVEKGPLPDAALQRLR
ncbi:MAG: aldo/keto reductase [Alphaproteobacteria bacterium]|jgi:aryl-alcohol dehydrogenase-like predicted oxidoreductase|nr:aldo/keto reductase [Alphaproteobacteria bacterium]